MRSRKKAIIFDMDGVLVDSERCYLKLINHFLKSNGIIVDEKELLCIVGATQQQSLEYISFLCKNKDSGAQVKLRLTAWLRKHKPSYRDILFSEVPVVIKNLYQKGYLLAIASSSCMDDIEEMLMETELKKYFYLTVSGEQFPKSKPDPAIYVYTAEKLNLKKEECLVIEDSEYGIEAAKRAGIDVIAIKREGMYIRQEAADMQITSLTELKKYCENN